VLAQQPAAQKNVISHKIIQNAVFCFKKYLMLFIKKTKTMWINFAPGRFFKQKDMYNMRLMVSKTNFLCAWRPCLLFTMFLYIV